MRIIRRKRLKVKVERESDFGKHVAGECDNSRTSKGVSEP